MNTTAEPQQAAEPQSMEVLQAALPRIEASPKECGSLELIVRRPQVEAREVLTEAVLDQQTGLAGDTWLQRGSRRRPDGSADPDAQLTLMNARVIALVAGRPDLWPLAGDQLFVDLDLSIDNLPPGTRLSIGDAMIEMTAPPHTGCKKFLRRFGPDALAFVNSPRGKELRLRGANARILTGGKICVGSPVLKLASRTGG
ncbi:MAG TPA: MOSC domain-containing protein [Verrucomicrobiae bacterium]|nr:MOSC domain-containing protein [Verrucomicrobiae bacterium]